MRRRADNSVDRAATGMTGADIGLTINCAASADNGLSGVATGFCGADIGRTDFVCFNECFCFLLISSITMP